MDEWMQCCDDADVVSFDIFDTLILRNVLKPTDMLQKSEVASSLRQEKYQNRLHRSIFQNSLKQLHCVLRKFIEKLFLRRKRNTMKKCLQKSMSCIISTGKEKNQP